MLVIEKRQFVALLALVLLFIGIAFVQAWVGPTAAPPSGNVAAPLNVGTSDQIKNAGLGLNSLAVFGNAILSGTSRYLNFGTTAGSSGYGFRDNAGTMEFKNSAGSWQGIASTTTAGGTGTPVLFDSGWVPLNTNTLTIASSADLSGFHGVTIQAKGSSANTCFTSTNDVISVPASTVHYYDAYPSANRSQIMGWTTQVTSNSLIFRLWKDSYGVYPVFAGTACGYYLGSGGGYGTPNGTTLLRFIVY